MTIWSVVLRNAASGYLKVLTALAVGFALTPVIIHELGTADYGLWLLILAIVSYFQLFDLGFTRALMHETALSRGRGEEEETKQASSSYLLLFTILAFMMLVATLVLVVLLPDIFGVEESQRSTARWILLLVGGAWSIQFPASYAIGVLQGYERFEVVNGTGSLSRILGGITTVAVLALGGGLVAMAITITSFEFLRTAIRVFFAWRVLKGFNFSIHDVSFAHIRRSFGRSVSYFSSATRNLINFRADPLIIGAFLPLSAVGVYGVALRLVMLARTLSTPLSEALTPGVSRVMGQDKKGRELKRIIINGTRISAGIMAAVTVFTVVFGQDFLRLWIGPEVKDSYEPLIILSIATLVILAHDMPSRVLMASDVHHINWILNVLNILINVGLSLALINRFELIGVATGTLVAAIVVGVITIFLGCRIAELSPLRFIAEGLAPPFLPMLPSCALGYGLKMALGADTWILLVLETAAAMAVFGLSFLLLNPPLRIRSFDLLTAGRKLLAPKPQAVTESID